MPSRQSSFVEALGQNHPAGHGCGAILRFSIAVLSPPTSAWQSVPAGHAVLVSDGLLVAATALMDRVVPWIVISPPLPDVANEVAVVTATLTLVPAGSTDS